MLKSLKKKKGHDTSPSQSPLPVVDRHGDIFAVEPEAGGSTPTKHDGQLGILTVTINEIRGFPKVAANLYCIVENDQQQARTKDCPATEPFLSDSSVTFDVTRRTDITVWVYRAADEAAQAAAGGSRKRNAENDPPDEDVCVGRAVVPNTLRGGETREDFFQLRNMSDGPEGQPIGELNVRLVFEAKVFKVSMDDFTVLKVIGKGSFGKVMMVRKKDTGRVYAVKALRKQYLSEKGEIEHTVSERQILAKNSNPFLVSLKFSFQTPEKLYFVLDYVDGGELFVHLQREGCFSEQRSRLYTAQLILALDHLHQHSIIYRDLKPENILVDMNGFIKLTDFGLCKENVDKDGKTRTFCGTPEYMAPEILEQKPYGMEVDWWTVGTLLYEMLAGLPPFYDQNTQKMYQKILHQPLRFGDEISATARDLIKGLLERNPTLRLGRTGVQAIKGHLFFEPLNWADLMAKKIRPPWKPRLVNALDTSNFDPEFTNLEPKDSIASPTRLTMSVQAKFNGFSFIAPSEMAAHRND